MAQFEITTKEVIIRTYTVTADDEASAKAEVLNSDSIKWTMEQEIAEGDIEITWCSQLP